MVINHDAEALPCLHCHAAAHRPCVTPTQHLSQHTHHVRVEALGYCDDSEAACARRRADAVADGSRLTRRRKEGA